jgi:hypothetical protein
VFKELAPIANFDILKTGMYGVFTNKSQQAKSVSWDFGDNVTSILLSPSHLYLQKGRYKVTLTVTNNCGDQAVYSDSIIIDGNSSVVNIEKNNLKLYPNPVSNYLHVEVNNISNGTYNAFIHDIYGRIIWNEEIQVANSKLNSILNMTSLSNGMYWLSIESNSKNIIKNEKIIINK